METISSVFENVPLDYLVVGGIALVIALDALRGGIGRAVAIAIALPLALLLSALAKEAAFLGDVVATPLTSALTLGVFAALLYILVRRAGFDFLDGGSGHPLQAAITGVSVAIIATVVWLEADSVQFLWSVGPHLETVFAEQFRLFWLVGSFVALAFVRG